MHNDHDTIGTFPPGGIDDPGWTGTWWNWAAFILPNLEQRNIYNAINFSLGNITATDDSLAAQDPNVTV